MEDKTLLMTAIAEMSFLKHHEKIILQENLSSIKELSRMSSDDIACLINRPFSSILWNNAVIEQRVNEILHMMAMFQINAVHIDDESYPALLREIFDPPYMLFYRGNLNVMRNRCVSVVGTRYPVRQAAEAAFHFAKDAAEEGYTVVSGLALGIDSFAHRGSLSCEKEHTEAACAVLGTSIDAISPGSNKPLARVLLSKGGCIASEYAPGTPFRKWYFPARNRIISGLSPATLVADAPENSGALITADFALEQGRDVFFHRAALLRFEEESGEYRDASKKNKIARNALSYIRSGAPVISSFRDFLEQQEVPAHDFASSVHCSLFEGIKW